MQTNEMTVYRLRGSLRPSSSTKIVDNLNR